MAGLVLGVSGVDDTSITTGIRIHDVRVLDSNGFSESHSYPAEYLKVIGVTSVAAATAASVIAAYRGVRGLDESGVIAYAKDSGAKVASDRHSIPVLRCLTKEK